MTEREVQGEEALLGNAEEVGEQGGEEGDAVKCRPEVTDNRKLRGPEIK